MPAAASRCGLRRSSSLALMLLALTACKKAVKPEMVYLNPPLTAGSRPWKISSARSAAPPDVSREALIIDNATSDTIRPAELALGANGWTCWPDHPGTPDPDPVCRDAGGREWEYAVAAHRPPRILGMGVLYRLQGGNSASDADPALRAPLVGQQWIKDPPHVGIILANPQRVFVGVPTTRQKDRPWVRFAGTPWAYLVIPTGSSP
jgi:hypothetical protein